jgi:hypothetical protein
MYFIRQITKNYTTMWRKQKNPRMWEYVGYNKQKTPLLRGSCLNLLGGGYRPVE